MFNLVIINTTVVTVDISAELSLILGPNLKVISTLSVGFDHLALDEIKKRCVGLTKPDLQKRLKDV